MYIPIQRNYKDTLFRMIFQDKVCLLSLYNALNGTNYANPEELQIETLQNAIYMNMKNDLAFVIDSSINLYEHQSTYSPNLPVRDLFYISREFEKFVTKQSLYSSKLVEIPTPKFLVFYNGTEKEWSRKQLRLSDAYKKPMQAPELELVVTMINLNHSENMELLKKCQTLLEYTKYVEKVRSYAKEMDISKAVQRAVEESIREGILEAFLTKYRAEAIQMSIFEYDEEKELKLIRRDERELGRLEGLAEGIRALVLGYLEDGESEVRILQKLMKLFRIEEAEAKEWIYKVERSDVRLE